MPANKITDAQLITEANVIANETVSKANTKTRIAQMFLDLIGSKHSIKDGKVWVDCGTWDASSNAFPTNGGTGDTGAILRGNTFEISAPGNLIDQDGNPQAVVKYATIRALADIPGQDGSKWRITF